jgi:hypothetical protein
MMTTRTSLGGVCMNSNWSDVTRLLPRSRARHRSTSATVVAAYLSPPTECR